MVLFQMKKTKMVMKRIKRVSVLMEEVIGGTKASSKKIFSEVSSDRFKSHCSLSCWPLTPAIICPRALGHTSFLRLGYETSKASW